MKYPDRLDTQTANQFVSHDYSSCYYCNLYSLRDIEKIEKQAGINSGQLSLAI
jgi:hypothetical protein